MSVKDQDAKLSRRSFLKGAAMVGGAAAASALSTGTNAGETQSTDMKEVTGVATEIEIKFKVKSNETVVKINGVKVENSIESPEEPTKGILDKILVVEGSTCVWRNGRLWCA